jgi:hypothetical protein
LASNSGTSLSGHLCQEDTSLGRQHYSSKNPLGGK